MFALKPISAIAVAALSLSLTAPAIAQTNDWQSRELARFKAPEADQGATADQNYFYAISNRKIGKYKKSDGALVARWEGEKDGPIIHLNAGIVKGGRLYAAHSNFPHLPMISSVEIWDTKNLEHLGSHNFGKTDGSLTWVNYHEGHWYACFAQYRHHGGQPGRGPEWTRLVQYDDHWRPLKEWKFPTALVARFGNYSCSGGSFGPGGYLYVTGHDAKELYVVSIPQDGAVLNWLATVPVSFAGQSFGWDPSKADVLYAISRKTREVVVTEILPPANLKPAQ